MAKESISYLPGEDSEDMRANREHQMALERLLTTLDARQNGMFDPTLLALAEGFLKPTQTGSFGESLGYAAAGMRQAQEKQLEQEQKLAQARLELAGQGLTLQRQKARERMFREAIGGEGTPTPGEPAEEPSGAPAGASPGPTGAGAVATGVAQADAGRLAEPGGIQVGRPDPSFPTYQRFMATMMQDPAVSIAEAQKRWQELQQKRTEVREGGVYDRATGMFYPSKPDQVEVQIYGSTYKVPPGIAAQLNRAQEAGDMAAYKRIADRYLQRGEGGTPESGPVSVSEAAARAKEEETRRTKLAEEAAVREANLGKDSLAAESMFGAATRVIDYVTKSRQAFGLFMKPGILSAFGKLVDDGLRLGNIQVGLKDFEGAVRGAMPNISQQDLDRVNLVARELAEVELAYTRLYMSKQGAITEGERAITRLLGGKVSDSPDALLQKAKFIAANSQWEMNKVDLFYRMKDKNEKLTYLQFERSPEYLKLKEDYNKHLAATFGGQAAIPRSMGPLAPSGPTAAPTTAPAAPTAPAAAPPRAVQFPGPPGRVVAPPMGPGPAAPARFGNALQRLESIPGIGR